MLFRSVAAASDTEASSKKTNLGTEIMYDVGTSAKKTSSRMEIKDNVDDKPRCAVRSVNVAEAQRNTEAAVLFPNCNANRERKGSLLLRIRLKRPFTEQEV